MPRSKPFRTHGLTFAKAEELLGDYTDRPVPKCGNTRIQRIDYDTICIRFYATTIVKIHRSGVYQLNSGGFRTATTKARINQFSPAGLYQKGRVWFFRDGMEFHDGDCVRE